MFSREVDQPVGVYQNLGVSSKYRRYNELIHEAITLHNYELILRYSNHEIVTQKQKRKIFSPPLGSELWSPGNKCQCANTEP